jgi:Shedu protein SduA, C-terminal
VSNTELGKWTHRKFAVSLPAPSFIVDEFERTLSDATDERPLQTFFASQPMLLAPLAPLGSGYWCLDRPPLGAELIPDFLLATRSSAGFRWTMIELEGPNERALTRAGLPARKLAEALKQVRDWRSWLRSNIAYAREQLGLTEIDAECRAYVIIGRRAALDPKKAHIYRELSDGTTTIMSYDRLLELTRQNRVSPEGAK